MADAEICVGTLDDLESKGVVVVSAEGRTIAVFAHEGGVYAVDNRCPHMGFPLDRGSVADGILTCHWHQARFDLRSGCTFDLWADDVQRVETRVEDGVVYVSSRPTLAFDTDYHRARLRRGMEQNVALVQAKSLLSLLEESVDLGAIINDVVDYASPNLRNFGEGLVRLGCVANLYPHLESETAYQALVYAIRRIAEETDVSMPRRERQPLQSDNHDSDQLVDWLQRWILTRHRDGAERTLLTARRQFTPRAYADLLFGGASVRPYASGGHLLDACNKSFELVERLGWERGDEIFPLIVEALVGSTGEEEATHWQHPIDIVAPLREIEQSLPERMRKARQTESGAEDLTPVLLGDDPLAILNELSNSISAGVAPDLLARQVAYAAALRLARFALSNEVTDWFGPQHVFIYTNAVHQAVRRSPTPNVVRAIFHGAIAVYQDRFLNVPPAPLPDEQCGDALPDDARQIRKALLDRLDQRGQVEPAAQLVSHYARLGHPLKDMIDTLTFATVREDLDFHSLQVLEAGVCQYQEWEGQPEAVHILIGVTRNLAAHCPTRRAGQQTATIALRLHRGERIYEG